MATQTDEHDNAEPAELDAEHPAAAELERHLADLQHENARLDEALRVVRLSVGRAGPDDVSATPDVPEVEPAKAVG
jgi:hypothetical protein